MVDPAGPARTFRERLCRGPNLKAVLSRSSSSTLRPDLYTGLMDRLPLFPLLARLSVPALAVLGLVCLVAQPPAAHAWGNSGHRLVNKLAASTLPPSVPAFLSSDAAVNEIEYLGPEPDRWRSEERRVGKECWHVCRSRWSPYH